MATESKSWADADIDLPPTEVIENQDGTKTIISYKINDKGKKVKHTQKIKLVKVTESVDPAVAARRKWKRYGEEKNNKTIGPDARTTQFGEEVKLHLSVSWAKDIKQEAEEKKRDIKVSAQQTIKCRICQGDHFTSKCPYKDTLGAEKKPPATGSPDTSSTPSAAIPGSGASSYVPPHLRNRAPGAPPLHSDGRRERDDSTTLKIMNLNQNAVEDQLREVFSRFGGVNRVTIVRNRETRESRGIAFVEMDSIRSAEMARSLDGKGFMNMIMSVDWSKPKPKE